MKPIWKPGMYRVPECEAIPLGWSYKFLGLANGRAVCAIYWCGRSVKLRWIFSSDNPMEFDVYLKRNHETQTEKEGASAPEEDTCRSCGAAIQTDEEATRRTKERRTR